MSTDDAIAKQLEAGSLAPEPAMLTGARIGYARVGTVALAVIAFQQRDWRDENSPPSPCSCATVRLRRLPLPS